jgi:hypothetical protein
MRAYPRPTWLSRWVLLLGALWAPGSAVAHGMAHSRQAEQRHAHERLEAASAAHQRGASHGDEIESLDHHHDHDDIRIDDGMPSRGAIAMLAPSRLVVLPAVCFDTTPCEAAFVYAARPRADPDRGPPPQLRAPPVV